MSSDTIRESIWKHWTNQTGNCAECPAHDFGYRPRYAGGDIESHIMIVLSDPNDERDPERTDLVGPKPEDESWHYNYSAYNEWDMMEQYLNPIAERIRGCTCADDVYFTNAHKCPKVSGKGSGFSEEDRKALNQCREYISTEIKAVNPDAVVALSNEAINAVGQCSIIEFDGSKGSTEYVEDWVGNGKRFYGSNPAVVAGVHPSPNFLHLHLDNEWYEEEDHKTWYFDQLSESINSAIESG
jgi:uracil-DNA glycosylase